MTTKFGKVAVLYGGVSSEREVSLMSGKHVYAGLKERGIDAHLVDVQADIIEVLQAEKFDRVLNVLHGGDGENGTIQAVLDQLNIPYCDSGVEASALAMDKVCSKEIWQAVKVSTPDFVVLKRENDLAAVKTVLTLPLCIKPASGGSSQGVSKVTDFKMLKDAYQKAKVFDEVVIAEQWIEGDELTVGIVAGEVLPTVRIVTPTHVFYDYDAKYFDHSTIYECPYHLPAEVEKKLQALSLAAFEALNCRGWGRVDVMHDGKGNFWVLEINTTPGMTETSLVPKAAKAKGIEFPDLLIKILEVSL